MTKCYCDKCGTEITKEQQCWCINQTGGYYSHCDGELIHKDFCDKCLQLFLK